MIIVLCYSILFIVVLCIWHLEVTLVSWGCIQPPFRPNEKALLKDVLVYLLTAGWDWLWYLMRFCGADWNEWNYGSLQEPRQKALRHWSRFLHGSACTTCAFWVLWLAETYQNTFSCHWVLNQYTGNSSLSCSASSGLVEIGFIVSKVYIKRFHSIFMVSTLCLLACVLVRFHHELDQMYTSSCCLPSLHWT